jgi:hypothetical protein
MAVTLVRAVARLAETLAASALHFSSFQIHLTSASRTC